ncbi:hypothetical protein, partial [Ralstonia solanacearum]
FRGNLSQRSSAEISSPQISDAAFVLGSHADLLAHDQVRRLPQVLRAQRLAEAGALSHVLGKKKKQTGTISERGGRALLVRQPRARQDHD